MSEEQTFCVNHPTVTTVLRCNKCGNPICSRCAVRTPVGYRCKNCVKNQQAIFYTALWYDYVIAAIVSLVISGVAQAILAFIPFLGILIVFVGALVGGAVAEVVRAATGRRRGRYTWLVVAIGMIAASLPVLVWALLLQNMYDLVINGIYLVLAVGAAIARLRVG